MNSMAGITQDIAWLDAGLRRVVREQHGSKLAATIGRVFDAAHAVKHEEPHEQVMRRLRRLGPEALHAHRAQRACWATKSSPNTPSPRSSM